MAVSEQRAKEIRQATRTQILSHLEVDYEGDEQLMKEVWEECADDDELDVARDELGRIIALVRG